MMIHLRILVFSGNLISCFCWSLLFTGVESRIMHPDEVSALMSIRKALVDENENLRNWKSGDPCTSNWTGVLCFNQTMDDGYLHARELQLLNMNLSGNLSPDLGRLSYMQILDVMWNKIGGSIPKEIGNIKSLQLLLLNGNQLTGPLPEELGYLPNLDRIQIDQNYISGSLPRSFANLNKTKHFHMNNNSISGQIPPELSRLPMLVHMLLDNNNLSGYLPPELANMPSLLIIQLDNNNFSGSIIPASYGNMSHLLKLSLRNCSLQGQIPDFSNIQNLSYIDVRLNQLTGPIPWHHLSANMTTIDLSDNHLSGGIPTFFASLPLLQKLSLANNLLNGSVPSIIWNNRSENGNETLLVDLQNNKLSNISGSLTLPPNVTVRMRGNPLCANTNLVQFCGSKMAIVSHVAISQNVTDCPPQSCPTPYEYAPASPVPCFCAAPLLVGYRLKSPGFIDFRPYIFQFEEYLSSGLDLHFYQLNIGSPEWEEGPRLKMFLSLFPAYIDGNTSTFNTSEVLRIKSMFTGWKIPDSDIFGPYELLKFTLLDPYKDVIVSSSSSGVSKGALAGIVVGVIAFSLIFSALLILMLKKRRRGASKRRQQSKLFIKIDGVKEFAFEEMASATNNFDSSSMIGQGGYGKVYKGVRADGTIVAIKRAQEGSLQGEKEFLTEIELLSRLHHRNLVSLVGYCVEEEEQDLKTRMTISMGHERGGLYFFDEEPRVLMSSASIMSWHYRLGHPSLSILKNQIHGVNKVESLSCESCQVSKHCRASFKHSASHKSQTPFELVHSDVWGPFHISSNKFKYFVIFVDDYSRMTWLYLMKSRSELHTCFSTFQQEVQTQFDKKIKIVRTDNAKEYVNQFSQFLSSQGIIHQSSCSYTPQQNGVAERKHRHLLDTARTLMIHMHVPKHHWSDAILTSCFLINRMPLTNLDGSSPFSLLYPQGSPFHIPLKIFGCVCYVHNLEAQISTNSTLEPSNMLVYEYMSNGTLRDHLSGKSNDPMSFGMRLRIAMGSAKGILYLHSEADPPIFHRDIKATNILLDSRFTAKVADFGLSRLAPVPDLEGIVPGHVSTVVKGTPGYLDPEYFATRNLTDKSDVYSLGVVFLELLTGMPPILHGKNIVRVVNSAYVSGKIFSVIDNKMGSYSSECVEKFISLALRCCLDEPESRPSMAEVVRELEKIWSMMPESDTNRVDSLATDHEKVMGSPASSSAMRNPYVSSDISGSDLVSGAVHTISPR